MKSVKFFASLPIKIREVITRYSGEWPRNLKKMMALSKEMVMRESTVTSAKKSEMETTSQSNRSIICYACGEKGHISFRCSNKKKSTGTSTKEAEVSEKEKLLSLLKILNSKMEKRILIVLPTSPITPMPNPAPS